MGSWYFSPFELCILCLDLDLIAQHEKHAKLIMVMLQSSLNLKRCYG